MSVIDARFPRAFRLLTPKDYQAVFNDAPFRASVPELLVLSRRNGRDDARIGIIVGKKNCRLAYQRNRVKRLCRESFRQQKAELAGLDIIVLARKNVALLDNPTLSNTLSQLWKRVLKKARDPSVGPLNTQQDGC